ncbi:MAG: hypothetical protein KDA38_09205, partial [Planctomycetales bacterium]|nr:hypothetical protein [Planctomycetales bacterium]
YDAAFARDANNRLVLLVACNEPLGLHAVTPDGGTAWISRRFNTVTSIAVQSAKRRILVTNELGELLPIDDAGGHDSPRPLGNWPLTRLVSHSDVRPVNGSSLCGLSYEPNGRPVAVACDAELRELWTYPLPQAPLNSAVEPIVATNLLGGAGEWLFAGSDGSLHLVSCDGQFSDHFGHGTKITGIAARIWNNRPTLLICSPNGVECFAVAVEP